MSHYSTTDNRGKNGTNGQSETSSTNQMARMKQHPASTTASLGMGTVNTSGAPYLDENHPDSAMNAALNAMGGMEEVLGQIQAQMDFVNTQGGKSDER